MKHDDIFDINYIIKLKDKTYTSSASRQWKYNQKSAFYNRKEEKYYNILSQNPGASISRINKNTIVPDQV